jgi:DivIVA domain-containing protein
MDISPHTVRTTSFKSARKGYDPEEVDRFKETVAAAIESAQNQATAMEARARAAVARLQEISQAAPAPEEPQEAPTAAPTPASAQPTATPDDHETISRTLLVAQRAAETTVAEARAEAAQLIEDAKVEARTAHESERVQAENEVQALLARRDFLLGDTEQLEQHISTQRYRIREVADSLSEMLDRVPNGLGDARRPLMSASADEPTAAHPVVATD